MAAWCCRVSPPPHPPCHLLCAHRAWLARARRRRQSLTFILSPPPLCKCVTVRRDIVRRSWEAQSHGCADLLIKIQACPHFSWRFWWFAHTYLCPPPTPSTDQSRSLQCSPALLPTPANPDRPSQNFSHQGEILKILSWRKKKNNQKLPAFISSDAASSVQ